MGYGFVPRRLPRNLGSFRDIYLEFLSIFSSYFRYIISSRLLGLCYTLGHWSHGSVQQMTSQLWVVVETPTSICEAEVSSDYIAQSLLDASSPVMCRFKVVHSRQGRASITDCSSDHTYFETCSIHLSLLAPHYQGMPNKYLFPLMQKMKLL